MTDAEHIERLREMAGNEVAIYRKEDRESIAWALARIETERSTGRQLLRAIAAEIREIEERSKPEAVTARLRSYREMEFGTESMENK